MRKLENTMEGRIVVKALVDGLFNANMVPLTAEEHRELSEDNMGEWKGRRSPEGDNITLDTYEEGIEELRVFGVLVAQHSTDTGDVYVGRYVGTEDGPTYNGIQQKEVAVRETW